VNGVQLSATCEQLIAADRFFPPVLVPCGVKLWWAASQSIRDEPAAASPHVILYVSGIRLATYMGMIPTLKKKTHELVSHWTNQNRTQKDREKKKGEEFCPGLLLGLVGGVEQPSGHSISAA
jgi:hypothetical protein